MAGLETFLHGDHPILVRVLTGGGGSGKTRLAVELCEKAVSDDWNAGFVTRQELRRFHGAQNLSASRPYKRHRRLLTSGANSPLNGSMYSNLIWLGH